MTMTLTDSDPAAARHAMVASQLRPNSVDDQRVIAAMASIPREDFLPAAARMLAYSDTLAPLGNGRYANLPLATGRLLTAAELGAGDRVLLIGAAGGYTAAVLATIVAEVVAVESAPDLAALAREALAGVPGVQLVQGPLNQGHADGAPYDVLIIDGVVEHLPETLIAQVRTGGRVAAGVIDRGVARLATGRRTGGFGLQFFADYTGAPLPGFAIPKGFNF